MEQSKSGKYQQNTGQSSTLLLWASCDKATLFCCSVQGQPAHPDWCTASCTKPLYTRTRIKVFSSLLARSTQASLCSPRASPPTPPWPCLWSYLGYPDAKRSSQIAAFPWSGWSRAALSLFPVYFQEFYQWHTMHSPCLKVVNSHVQLSSVKRTGFKAIPALTLWLGREMDMQACLMCWKLHLKWT